MDCCRIYRATIGVACIAAASASAPLSAAAPQNWTADSWRSAPRSDKAREVPAHAANAALALALYEIAITARLCERDGIGGRLSGPPGDCQRAMHRFARVCTARYAGRFPRGDDAEVDGRWSHRKFAAGYANCLRDEYRGRHGRRAPEIARRERVRQRR